MRAFPLSLLAAFLTAGQAVATDYASNFFGLPVRNATFSNAPPLAALLTDTVVRSRLGVCGPAVETYTLNGGLAGFALFVREAAGQGFKYVELGGANTSDSRGNTDVAVFKLTGKTGKLFGLKLSADTRSYASVTLCKAK